MNIKIGNKRFETVYSGAKIYVGRPSPLGNPFAAKNSTVAAHRVQSDEDAVKCFRRYLWRKITEQNPIIMNALNDILREAQKGQVTLLCWCVDRHGNGVCHAHTIKSAVEWLSKKQNHQ